ncbi:MAG: hypothetical protein QM784_11850 [Polyangiaceae bacterium]
MIDAADANRFLELSFDSGTLISGEGNALKLQGSLHDSSWTPQVGANDYSYVPLVGYCDRITAYLSGRLGWGTEPVTVGDPYSGVGGSTSAGGATGEGATGGHSGVGGAAAVTTMGGSGLGVSSAGGASEATK